MKIKIRVIPNAKKVEIKKENDYLKIKLKSKPENGKANKELIEILSEYFNISKVKIRILSGLKSRNKVVEIEKN